MHDELPILTAPIDATSRRLGIGLTKTKQLIKCGIFETITIGHRRLVLQSSVERYLAEQRGKSTDGRRNPRAMDRVTERRRELRRQREAAALADGGDAA
jgi:hypothetical protein